MFVMELSPWKVEFLREVEILVQNYNQEKQNGTVNDDELLVFATFDEMKLRRSLHHQGGKILRSS